MIRLLLAVLVCAVTGCGLVGGDDVDAVDGEEANASLEQQRDDVRALTRELTERSQAAIGASVRTARGRWEGCDSAFNDTYRNYRYLTQVRMDATGDLPAALGPVVADAGLIVDEEASEPEKLRASGNDLSVSFWALPEAAEGSLLLTVHGECVDVAEDEREEWLDRKETEPDPLV